MILFNFKHVNFSEPIVKICDDKDAHPYDMAFPPQKVCTPTAINPLIPGTAITTLCYSEKLLTKIADMSGTECTAFLDYQIPLHTEKLQWLKQVRTLLYDNQNIVNQEYGTRLIDLFIAIDKKINALSPPADEDESDDLPPQPAHHPKLKTNLTVPQLAYLFKMLYELKPDIFDVKTKTELYRFISANFTTKGSDDISIAKLSQLFSDPDPDSAKSWMKHFSTMLADAKKFH